MEKTKPYTLMLTAGLLGMDSFAVPMPELVTYPPDGKYRSPHKCSNNPDKRNWKERKAKRERHSLSR